MKKFLGILTLFILMLSMASIVSAAPPSPPPAPAMGCTATTELCNNVDDDCDGVIDSFTESDSCSVAHGVGTSSRTCSSGVWSDWSICAIISCSSGYVQSDNSCVLSSCSGLSSQPCVIINGDGTQSRTCSSGVWSDWETCTVTSCDDGYQISDNSCVETNIGLPPEPPPIGDTSVVNTTTNISDSECVVSQGLYTELVILNAQLAEKQNASEDVGELESRIAAINVEINQMKVACVGIINDSDMSVIDLPPEPPSIGVLPDITNITDLPPEPPSIGDTSDNSTTYTPPTTNKTTWACKKLTNLNTQLEKKTNQVSQRVNSGKNVPKRYQRQTNRLESQIASYEVKCAASTSTGTTGGNNAKPGSNNDAKKTGGWFGGGCEPKKHK
jgi:hypothetical protein